jgi:HD superfamily phosphohydrolase YqeK
MTRRELHPILEAAAEGELPDWASVRPDRRRHLGSVAGLLARWALELGHDERECRRWKAAAWLHDALRDADPATLATEAGDFPDKLRHGPAAAARLRHSGVEDEELLEAIAYHSLGRRGLRRLGRFLYLADYLEPGRSFDPLGNAMLRARLPGDAAAALRAVCARRIVERVSHGGSLHPYTVDFWNQLVSGE